MRTDTSAQSESAEIRTVAELLNLGLIAGQYPRNFPTWDVFAFDQTRRKVVNIQVKYRHSGAASSVALRDTSGVDFVVVYRANAGESVAGRNRMQCWVVPMALVKDAKFTLGALPDDLLNAWGLIEDAARAD